jgi:hypothetical protein
MIASAGNATCWTALAHRGFANQLVHAIVNERIVAREELRRRLAEEGRGMALHD